MIMGQQFRESTDSDFFSRPVERVAPDLVGCFLFTNFDGKKAGGMILETEAYDENDVFSHCFVGASDVLKVGRCATSQETSTYIGRGDSRSISPVIGRASAVLF